MDTQQPQSPKTLIADIETDGLLDELTKLHCIVTQDHESSTITRYSNPSGVCGAFPDTAPDAIWDGSETLVFHNGINFDIPALEKLYPDWKPPKVFDTLVAARLIWPDIKEKDFRRKNFPKELIGSHSLKAWGYRLRLHKGDFGESTDWKEWSQEMEDYCVQDVMVTARLYELILQQNYSQEALDLEHEFAKLIFKQERHGFAFDRDKAVALYAKLSKRRNLLEDELQKVFPPKVEEMKTPEYWEVSLTDTTPLFRAKTKGAAEKILRDEGKVPSQFVIHPGPNKTKEIPFNPGSRPQIEQRLVEKYHWKPQQFTPSGRAEINEEILGNLPYPECKMLAEYFMIQKRIGQVAEGDNAWLKLERNGRIHGYVNTNGAVTGRCTHNSPNVAQVPAVRAPYGEDCRGCFTASEGFLLLGWDASGLELRCLAHYMARYDGGAYAKVLLEGDIHTENQKAAGLPSRDTAKTFIYGFLYGAGDAKIGQIVGKGAQVGKKLKNSFLKRTPALKRLVEAVQQVAKERGYLIGLDGRFLHVRSQHSALNTLLQGAGAVIMKKAQVLLYQNILNAGYIWGKDFAKVSDIHDEAEYEVRPEIAEHIGEMAIQSIKQTGEYFNLRCPLDGEYKIGETWADVH